MKVKNTKVLVPAISVAILALGGGYYGLQLVNNQNLPKALAYTSAINPVDPSTAPDSYEIKFSDELKHSINNYLNQGGSYPDRNEDSPITVGLVKNISFFGIHPKESENLEGLQYFTNLQYLNLDASGKLKDISAIKELKKIRILQIRGTQVEDISFVKNFKQLEKLWIEQTNITDFSPIKDLPNVKIDDINSNAIIKVPRNLKIFKNPFINFDGTIMPITDSDKFINVDMNGNSKQDGGYIKIIKTSPINDDDFFEIINRKTTLPNGNELNRKDDGNNTSYIHIKEIDANNEKPNIHFNFNGSSISLKENAPLVWEKPRQDNSTFNENTITSLKRDYSPQAGGTFFTATSPTSNITSITSDAEEVFNNKENQINGDYLITVTATNDFGNTTTAKFRLLAPFVNREPVKKALENFESRPDYIKKAIPTELVNEAKRIKTQSFDITNTQVTNAANALNNKITEIVLQQNEYKANVASAILEMNKNFDNLEDFKDIFAENSKILEQSVKEENLKELNKLAERYAKNAQKFEDILDKIINLQNIDKYSKETLKKLQEVMQAAEHVNVSTKLKTAEALAKSTENLASEADIIGLTNALENALNGLRANKTALNSQIKNFENTPKWLKDEVKAESQKAIEVQKADNPTIKEVQKATEDLKNAIEKAKKAEENRQKEASLKINEAQNILAENKSKPDELPVIDIEKIEELISKVKDEAKSKELTKKLQDIKDKIKAKEAKIELDKLEAARKKRDAEIAKQRLNLPETGFLREQNQENKATMPVLIGLVSLIISPVVVLFAKRRNRKMRKF